jgi:exosortase
MPCLAGLLLFVGGWKILHWAWPAVVFLVFMVPLPGFLADQFSHPLQRIGTIAGTYVIQTIGIPAVAQGNVISVPHGELGVAEACSGLRMMMLFGAVCAGMALSVKRTALEKLMIIASAAPIAVLANIARIVVTALLYEIAGPEWGEMLFHDLAGWFMMPLAVLLLWLELELMSRIVIRRTASGPLTPGVAQLNPGSG